MVQRIPSVLFQKRVVETSSPCDVVRNERQITYIKKRSKFILDDPQSDQVFSIMQSAKEEDVMKKFVCKTRPSPEPALV